MSAARGLFQDSDLTPGIGPAGGEIILRRTPAGWMATHTGPARDRIWSLFETDTLPTAFTEKAEPAMVLEEIRRLNPGVHVRISQENRR